MARRGDEISRVAPTHASWVAGRRAVRAVAELARTRPDATGDRGGESARSRATTRHAHSRDRRRSAARTFGRGREGEGSVAKDTRGRIHDSGRRAGRNTRPISYGGGASLQRPGSAALPWPD